MACLPSQSSALKTFPTFRDLPNQCWTAAASTQVRNRAPALARTKAAVVYAFLLRPDAKNRPYWIPVLIDEDSGAGEQVLVQDLNGDGRPEIVSGNKKGVVVFWQTRD